MASFPPTSRTQVEKGGQRITAQWVKAFAAKPDNESDNLSLVPGTEMADG